MKKFIIKIMVFAGLILLLINLLLFYLASENLFIKGIVAKHDLLKNTATPRLILVGGSGISYSVDSEMIAKTTNLNPINMGVFAQFGLRYMLEEVKGDIRKGDVILIVPEYHHFYYFFEGWRGLNELIYVYPTGLTHLSSIEQVKIMLKAFPRFFIKKVDGLGKNFIKKMERRGRDISHYNAYGDYIDHLKSTEIFEVDQLELFDSFVDTAKLKLDKQVFYILNEFEQQMQQKGATVYFLYPTIPVQQYEGYSYFIKEIQKAIEEKTDLRLLNLPQEATLSNENFHNTVYHLNKKGREKRTKKLIEVIEKIR